MSPVRGGDGAGAHDTYGFDAHLLHVREVIGKHGWAVQGVFPTKADELWFSYTVGLTEAALGLPELAVSGLPGEQGQQVLNLAAVRHVEDRFRVGDTVEGVVSVPLRVIDAMRAPVGIAARMYGSRPIVLQLVWPDDNEQWPGSPSYSSKFRQELFGWPWW